MVCPRRLVYQHPCIWGQPLSPHPPEALESLGVTQSHWANLAAAYEAVVVVRGNRWQRVHKFAAHGLIVLYFSFILLLVMVWYLGSASLVANVGLVGVFFLLGFTIIANVGHDVARTRILLGPLEQDVVQVWNYGRRQDRLPIHLVLRREVTCRHRNYSLAFIYRRGDGNNNDDDTVASENL